MGRTILTGSAQHFIFLAVTSSIHLFMQQILEHLHSTSSSPQSLRSSNTNVQYQRSLFTFYIPVLVELSYPRNTFTKYYIYRTLLKMNGRISGAKQLPRRRWRTPPVCPAPERGWWRRGCRPTGSASPPSASRPSCTAGTTSPPGSSPRLGGASVTATCWTTPSLTSRSQTTRPSHTMANRIAQSVDLSVTVVRLIIHLSSRPTPTSTGASSGPSQSLLPSSRVDFSFTTTPASFSSPPSRPPWTPWCHSSRFSSLVSSSATSIRSASRSSTNLDSMIMKLL